MAIAELFLHHETLDQDAVFARVRDAFPAERYCSPPVISGHLQSLKAVGILEEHGSTLDEHGNLVSRYRITNYGRARLAAFAD
jgi:DNA-binding PadR family transcriptional regulator